MSRMTGLLVYCNTEWISGSTYYSACYPDHHISSAYPSYCPVSIATSCTLDPRYSHLRRLYFTRRAHCDMLGVALLSDLSLLNWSQGMSLVALSIAASRDSRSLGAVRQRSYRLVRLASRLPGHGITAMPLSNETHPRRRVRTTHFVIRISLAFRKEDV